MLKRDEVPPGFIIMTGEDARQNWDACLATLGEWSIVTMLDAKIGGWGYKYNFSWGDFRGCGGQWTWVMTDDGRPDQNIEPCP